MPRGQAKEHVTAPIYRYAVPGPAHAEITAPPIHQIKIHQSLKISENDKSAKYNSHQYFLPYGSGQTACIQSTIWTMVAGIVEMCLLGFIASSIVSQVPELVYCCSEQDKK